MQHGSPLGFVVVGIEGNRLRRTVIGFGAGASTLDTSVEVDQLISDSRHLVLDFTTHADSGWDSRDERCDGRSQRVHLITEVARRQDGGSVS
jgi:hypothetical protein